ncbi:hypothetical protein H8356DRAFT_1317501 [Neocallimastix lanati (nom. inval.)]|nr:hypothetical protein H8356DRAFT_1317501 [Neocallimastix sp. JGI-2020a]
MKYLDNEKIEFDDKLLWKGKLYSLVSLVFNLSSLRDVREELINLFLEISQIHIKQFYYNDFCVFSRLRNVIKSINHICNGCLLRHPLRLQKLLSDRAPHRHSHHEEPLFLLHRQSPHQPSEHLFPAVSMLGFRPWVG